MELVSSSPSSTVRISSADVSRPRHAINIQFNTSLVNLTSHKLIGPESITSIGRCSSSRNFSSKHGFFHVRRRSSATVSGWKQKQIRVGAYTQITDATGYGLLLSKTLDFGDALWRFLRPHTIRGTTLASISLLTRAILENPNMIGWSLVARTITGFIALICGNGYIVGINQIYDIEIDKVNKPYLPIASGDFSVEFAWCLVSLFAVSGLSIVATTCGPFLTSLYCLALSLGTIYSVPPFRIKRFPVMAFLAIATVRGFLLNFGVCYATRATLGLTLEWSSPMAFLMTFVTLFALVIAITKDLPDVEGDRKFEISTFATKLGVRNMALLASGLLLMIYVGSVLAAIYKPQAFNSSLMIPAHTILALTLIFQAWVLERANYTKDATTRFYRFIWGLLYAEYIVFPFI